MDPEVYNKSNKLEKDKYHHRISLICVIIIIIKKPHRYREQICGFPEGKGVGGWEKWVKEVRFMMMNGNYICAYHFAVYTDAKLYYHAVYLKLLYKYEYKCNVYRH